MTERSHPQLKIIALVAVLSMLAASCGLSRETSGSTAATITFTDGSTREIASSELNEFYDTMEEDIDFTIGAFGEAGLPPGLRASILSDMVVGAILDDLLDEAGAEPSEEEVAEGAANLQATIASFFPLDDDPNAAAEARFETLPYLPFLASLQAKQSALGTALADEAGGGTAVEVPCSSHILVETEDVANDVIGLLDDGGDFAELAMEFSIGPSGPTGGVLGCTDPNGFVAEFRDAIVDAPVGTIIGPVQTEFGFHVITVTAIEEQVLNAPDPLGLVSTSLLSAISQVEVDVANGLGEWDATQGAVIPPG